jgi:hypothetical protein
MARLPKLDPVEFLIERRFPDFRLLQSAPPQGRVGNLSAEEAANQRRKMADYEAELRQKSEDEIAALYEQESTAHQAEKEKAAQLEEKQRFFNQPAVDADLVHWAKMAVWRLEEATMLLFGKDPAEVSWEQLKSFANRSDFAKKYAKSRELVVRAWFADQLTDPVSPAQFLGWAQSLDLGIPEGLIELVEKHSGSVASFKERYEGQREVLHHLEEQLEQLQSSGEIGQVLGNNEAWLEFSGLAIKVINQYPDWRKTQKKVQKTGNLQDWLTKTIGANNREAEILKRFLSEAFDELK